MSHNPNEIKAISVVQPWATLIAIGAKRIETRTWATGWRGRLAIAASGTIPRASKELCAAEPFRSVLADAGVVTWHDLPRGAIVALARIEQVIPTTRIAMDRLLAGAGHEGVFGDYSPGRYGWVLADVQRVRPVVPAKGRLGLWAPPYIPLENRHPLDARSAS